MHKTNSIGHHGNYYVFMLLGYFPYFTANNAAHLLSNFYSFLIRVQYYVLISNYKLLIV